MQESKKTQSNRERSVQTRTKLLNSARQLFVEHGYADTGTPEIVKNAKLTRGALHHHFDGKEGIFRALLVFEAELVAEQIAAQTTEIVDPVQALVNGTNAYFDAMSVPGRAQLLLIEGPAVLGIRDMNNIDAGTGRWELEKGLELALGPKLTKEVALVALATIVSAAFDRAALAISAGESVEEYQGAIQYLLEGLARN